MELPEQHGQQMPGAQAQALGLLGSNGVIAMYQHGAIADFGEIAQVA
jgi:hypothetical protein